MEATSHLIATAPFVLPDAPAEPDLVAKYFRGLRRRDATCVILETAPGATAR